MLNYEYYIDGGQGSTHFIGRLNESKDKWRDLSDVCLSDWYCADSEGYDFVTSGPPEYTVFDEGTDLYLSWLKYLFPVLEPYDYATMYDNNVVFNYSEFSTTEIVVINSMLRIPWEVHSFGATYKWCIDNGASPLLAATIAQIYIWDYTEGLFRSLSYSHHQPLYWWSGADLALRSYNARRRNLRTVKDEGVIRPHDKTDLLLFGKEDCIIDMRIHKIVRWDSPTSTEEEVSKLIKEMMHECISS